MKGEHSYQISVRSGVPQGTVLGPLLFLIYINDLEDCIIDSTLSCFADDSSIKKKIQQTADRDALQADLNKVEEWSSNNNMSLHSELPLHQQYFQYTTQKGVEINPQSTVKDLGVMVTADLSWTTH